MVAIKEKVDVQRTLTGIFGAVTLGGGNVTSENFEQLQAICGTDRGVKRFMSHTDQFGVVATILALACSAGEGHKDLAAKILSQKKQVFVLAKIKKQADRLMTLLENGTFDAEQVTQILSVDEAVWQFVYQGQANRLMILLEGGALDAQQKTQILTSHRAVRSLAYQGQADRLMSLLEGDVFDAEQVSQILSSSEAITALVRKGQADKLMTLLENKTFDVDQVNQILQTREFVEDLAQFGQAARLKAWFERLNSNVQRQKGSDSPIYMSLNGEKYYVHDTLIRDCSQRLQRYLPSDMADMAPSMPA